MIPPMYWHTELPKEPPPEPRKESRSTLSEDLTLSITERDLDKARHVMDRAFWGTTGFQPDWFHLYLALQNEDRGMVRFLLAYGTEMSPVTVTVCQRALKEKMDSMMPLLAAHGIRPLPPGEKPEERDVVEILSRLALEASRYATEEDKKKTAQALQKHAVTAFIKYVQAGDMAAALHVMHLSGQDTVRGIDISKPVSQLLSDHFTDKQQVLDFIHTLIEHDDFVKLKPINLRAADYTFIPQLIVELHKHGLIGKGTYDDRVRFLSTRQLYSVRGLDDEHKEITKILFDKKHPATTDDVDDFIQLHNIWGQIKILPTVMEILIKELSDLGFFDSPAWTADKLLKLGQQAMPAHIATGFNRRARRMQIDELGLEHFLSIARLHDLVEAHKIGAFRADAKQAIQILDYMQTLMTTNLVHDMSNAGKLVTPQKLVFHLIADLKEHGTDFSAVDPMKYLGKKDPGIAKILLDLDIVKAENFDLHAIKKLNGGKMEIITPSSSKYYPYTEFMAQIIMQNTDPKKYLSCLHNIGGSWQETLHQTLTADNKKGFELSLNFKRRGTESTGPK